MTIDLNVTIKPVIILMIIAFSSLTFSLTAFANEENLCVDHNGNDIYDQPEVFQKIIEYSSHCKKANDLAVACFQGSRVDVRTGTLAFKICETEFYSQKPNNKKINNLHAALAKCEMKYPNEGSLDQAQLAYCKLNAVVEAL